MGVRACVGIRVAADEGGGGGMGVGAGEVEMQRVASVPRGQATHPGYPPASTPASLPRRRRSRRGEISWIYRCGG